MGKRVGLLAGLLVLALGSGVVAQDPEPTPQFAPEDLAFTLPSRVGDFELDIDTADELDLTNREMWRDLLLPFGKEPGDVRQASAEAYLSGQTGRASVMPAFQLFAMRIDGVPARDYTERFMDLSLQTVESFETLMPLLQFDWRDIDGRKVYSSTLAPPEALVQWATEMAEERGIEPTEQQLADIRAYQLPNPDTGAHLYPKGEVLFAITVPSVEDADDPPSLAEILAELP